MGAGLGDPRGGAQAGRRGGEETNVGGVAGGGVWIDGRGGGASGGSPAGAGGGASDGAVPAWGRSQLRGRGLGGPEARGGRAAQGSCASFSAAAPPLRAPPPPLGRPESRPPAPRCRTWSNFLGRPGRAAATAAAAAPG